MRKVREYKIRKEESVWLYIHDFYCYLQKTQENNMLSINTVNKNICTLSINALYICSINPLSDNNAESQFLLEYNRDPEQTGINTLAMNTLP